MSFPCPQGAQLQKKEKCRLFSLPLFCVSQPSRWIWQANRSEPLAIMFYFANFRFLLLQGQRVLKKENEIVSVKILDPMREKK